MATPAKPRTSGLPGPKYSSIPTPGSRSRSSSVIGDHPPISLNDAQLMSRAFQEAIKANDPAQHRSARHSDASTASSSTVLSAPPSQSHYTRPSSAAAKSRPKTPTAAAAPRPPSRASDAYGRSVSRAGRDFDVGDLVRIESLGMEGTVRYLGPIDGKEGLFAGVELGSGFAGHGKNDGSVAGKYYFRCADKCGVFVPYAKLSPPAIRPSSVASSRNGRTTPSISASLRNGTVTPSSFTSGRVTPSSLSSGRVTPGTTPSARPRQLTKPVAKTPTAKSTSISSSSASSASLNKTPGIPQVTPGSRAAKLAGMTAKQLSSNRNGAPIPQLDLGITASPSKIGGLVSPIVGPIGIASSPYGTPKAKLAGLLGRTTSAGTPTKPSSSASAPPRPRIPSAIAMPPPPSPSLSRSVSRSSDFRDDASSFSDLAKAGKALEDRMAQVMSGGANGTSSIPPSPSRPSSVTAIRSEYTAQIDRLQARLAALEFENERLRNASPPVVSSPPPPAPSSPPPAAASASSPPLPPSLPLFSDSLETPTPETPPEPVPVPVPDFTEEREKLTAQITELQAKLDSANKTTKDSEAKIDSLIASHKTAIADLEKQVSERSKSADDYKAQLDDAIGELKGLLSTISTKEEEERKNEQLLAQKDTLLAEAEKRYTLAQKEWEEEKKDLDGQVDELRQAGQETIALYEEKLNSAEAQKYELNARVSSLQATLHRRTASQASIAPPTTGTTAVEIDNETLREHVTHLQKRISSLEDQLEDQKALAERDEAATRERLKRAKDKEDAVKKDMVEMKKEMDVIAKAEMQARSRVEEIEEALRENGVALENARAEVEIIRAEMADLDGLVGTDIEGDLHARVAQAIERATTDKKRYTDEIQKLQQQLLEAKGSAAAPAESTSLNDTMANLESKNAELEKLNRIRIETLESERKAHEEVQRLLDERTSELESLKKKLNREHGINGITRPTSPAPTVPKSDFVAAKEEIKGLKAIIQELQKESSAAAQREQVLESENQLLSTEADQLRQEIKILEENLDKSIDSEDGNSLSPALSGDVETLRTMMQEQKTKFEAELAQQRKKVVDAEQKAARTVHDLNKEISELEALVESKIYREDELEREIERLKRQRKANKVSPDPPAVRNPRGSTASMASVDSTGTEQQEVCEICEQPGHDIFNCTLLKDDGKASESFTVSSAMADLFCEDCEGHGHTADNCPHSLDVF